MVSLARSTLLFEWRRFLAGVLAVTFSGLLVVVQLALLLGLFGTVSMVIEQSGADLWIGFRNTQSVDLGRSVSRFSAMRAWAHPDVLRVERYVSAFGDLRRADGAPTSVVINAVDAASDGLALAHALSPQTRALLREPSAILVDPADLDKLGAAIGTEVEINGRRARVAGTADGLRAVGGVNVVTSLATARALAPEAANETTFFLLKLRPGADVHAVAADVADTAPFPRYSVWEASAFSTQSQLYWLLESGVGVGSGFASLLALIVGVVITSQTLSAAILSSIKEYAALRALGVSMAALRLVVAEQSIWVGLAGLGVTAALTALAAALGGAFRVAMRFPVWMLAGTAVVMLLVALLSGLLALRPLKAADPASLLR